MFKRLLKIIILLTFFASLTFAQEIYLCESYTEDGVPVGPKNKLDIKPYGTAIYVLLDYQKEFGDPLLYLFVDKFVDGKFTPFESKTISIGKEEKWAVTSFEFKEEGTYELYFLNSTQKRLATHKVEVSFAKEFKEEIVSPISNTFSDDQFVFCELVIKGKPVNPFHTLSLSRSAGQAFIYINNYTPFGIDKIKIQVWKKSASDEGSEEMVDSKKYKILPEWSDTFFKYIFTNTGEFKIDVFDFNDNFISSNILTIIN